MVVDVAANTFDPPPARPEGMPDPKLFRYNLNFYTGPQKGVILYCEEHRKKGSDPKSAPTSIKVVLGLESEEGLVRCDHYPGLGASDRERFGNLVAVLEPGIAEAVKAKRKPAPFDCDKQVGKWVDVLIEAEAGQDGYKPRVTRLVALTSPAPWCPKPAPAQAAPAPSAAPQPTTPAPAPSTAPF